MEVDFGGALGARSLLAKLRKFVDRGSLRSGVGDRLTERLFEPRRVFVASELSERKDTIEGLLRTNRIRRVLRIDAFFKGLHRFPLVPLLFVDKSSQEGDLRVLTAAERRRRFKVCRPFRGGLAIF